MDYTSFGKTGLTVSVAGLGCGGNSRLGLGRGKSHDHAVSIVRAAFDAGVNFFDTAEVYGTENAVGDAVSAIGRDKVVISTKSRVRFDDTMATAGRVVENLEQSLRALRTDYIDIYNLHAVITATYDHAVIEILPALQRAREQGKIRHIGITESPPNDPGQEMLQRALTDPVWESAMFAFHMMNQGARRHVFPLAMANGAGTMLMFVVRNIFSQPDVLRDTLAHLAVDGRLSRQAADELARDPEPLGFLVHESGASSILDAAYRFVRHEPGTHVTLFGTSDVAHLEANIASILRPPLPDADREKLSRLFGHLTGIGLDLPGPPSRGQSR